MLFIFSPDATVRLHIFRLVLPLDSGLWALGSGTRLPYLPRLLADDAASFAQRYESLMVERDGLCIYC